MKYLQIFITILNIIGIICLIYFAIPFTLLVPLLLAATIISSPPYLIVVLPVVLIFMFNSIDEFISFHSYDSDNTFIDIHNIKRRIPDDVAIEIINQSCKVNHPTEVSTFSLLDRRNAIFLLNENGISARQINRLTGIPRGIIDRILSNKL